MQRSKMNRKRLVPLVVLTAVVTVVLVFAGPAIYAAWLADQNEDYWKPHLRPPVEDASTIPVYTDPEIRDQLSSLFLYDPHYCGGDRGIYSKVDSKLLRKLKARGRKDNGDFLLALADPDDAVRAGAAHLLGTLGDDNPEVLNALVDACQLGWGDRRGDAGYETRHALRDLAPEVASDWGAWFNCDFNYEYQSPLFQERLARLREWQEELRRDWQEAENRAGVLETLLQTIDQEYSIRHIAAMEVLAGFGPEAAPGTEVLIDALTLEDKNVQREAGKLLTRIGEPAVAGLMEILPRVDDETATAIHEVLAAMQDIDTLPYLDDLLVDVTDPPDDATFRAARLIRKAGPSAIPRIAYLLDSDAEQTIELACNMLCNLNANAGRDPEDYVETVELNKLTPRLLEIAHNDDLHLAAHAMYPLQYSYPMDPAIPRFLAANMAERSGSGLDGVPWLIACTMVALPKMRPIPEDVIAHLVVAGLGHSSAEERGHYLRDFRMMGAEAGPALPYIREMAETDPDAGVRKLAAEVARSIEAAVDQQQSENKH